MILYEFCTNRSDNEYRGSVDPPVSERIEGLVRVVQWKYCGLGVHRHFRGHLEELIAVLPREVCHGSQDLLTPQNIVGEGRDVAHVYARTHYRTSRPHGPEAVRDELTDWSEDDCGAGRGPAPGTAWSR